MISRSFCDLYNFSAFRIFVLFLSNFQEIIYDLGMTSWYGKQSHRLSMIHVGWLLLSMIATKNQSLSMIAKNHEPPPGLNFSAHKNVRLGLQ